MRSKSTFRILHISDLHITTNKEDKEKANFDQGLVLDSEISAEGRRELFFAGGYSGGTVNTNR